MRRVQPRLPLFFALILLAVPSLSRAQCSNANFWCQDGNSAPTPNRLGTFPPGNGPIQFFTNGAYRGLIAANGQVGFGTVTTPQSLLHLGQVCPATGGVRSWMKNGAFTCNANDNLYVGLKVEPGGNHQDAVIAWGDDTAAGSGPDAFRVIFVGGTSTPAPGNSFNGLEVARFQPNGNVGIGDFFTPALLPKNRLDVKGGAVIGGALGGSAIAPPDGLLVQGNTGLGTTSPSARLDVNGTARIQNLSGGPHAKLVTADNGGFLHSLVFPGSTSLVLLGNGTFGPSAPDNDWSGAGTGNMFATSPNDNVSIGFQTGPGKLNVLNSGGQTKGGYFECNTSSTFNDLACVQGFAHAPNVAINIGVWADAAGNNQNFGVEANALKNGASQNIAVRALAGGGSTANFGILAQAPGGGAFNKAGWFNGDVHVSGTLSKSAGSFKIDHPLDPEERYLAHSFVESPDMMNVYNGNVTTDSRGDAWVELPSYFEALNRDYRYQLTVVGQFAQAIVGQKVRGNRFLIRTDKPAVEVSWQVTGIRNDPYARAHRIEVEPEKAGPERGTYLHPELYDAPEETQILYELTTSETSRNEP